MQGQKGAVGSLPEGLALEHGSGSSDSGVVEQQLSWSNFIRNPPANVNQETQSLSMWSVGESSSSIVPNQVDPTMGREWSSVIKAQSESHQHELAASRLSLGGVNMNTSHIHTNNTHHHYAHNITVNPSTFIGMQPSDYASSSSGPVKMDARQLPCKRKAPELDIGQSSSGIEGSNILQRPEGSNSVWQSVSENPTTNTMPFDPIIPRLGSGIGGIGGVSSDNCAMENFRRNVRVRFDDPRLQDQLPASNNNISNNMLLNFSAQYPSLGLNPVATTGEGSSSCEGQPMLQAPVLRRNLYASSRNRSSSSRANPLVTSSIISTSGDNLRTTPTNISDHSLFVQPHDIRNTAQTAVNLDVDTVGGPTSLSSASNPMLNMGPHRGSSLYRSRRQGEILRRSLLSSIDSGAGGGGGGQNTNLFSSIPPPVGASASSSQESRAPRVIAIAGRHPRHHHLAHLRTSSRQLDGAFGFPYVSRTVAGGSGRGGRLMSEMRNVLDRLRRGEGLRFEDVMILDQSVFYDMADIHDRHRDMRLDIDNMSYEELLALEERIGNVNTGLTEENIYKHLKQKTYTHVSGQPNNEPCCICQEEYKNGEDLGALDCGHEFHTSCIKQWLLQKNSCPACKSAASK